MMEQKVIHEKKKKREEGRQALETKKREKGRQAPEAQPEPGANHDDHDVTEPLS